MEKKVLAEKIGNFILNGDFFQQYAYKHYWTSGSSTEVPPVSIWCDRLNPEKPIKIEIQVARDGVDFGVADLALDLLICGITAEFGDVVTRHYLYESDGSCPNVAVIYINN